MLGAKVFSKSFLISWEYIFGMAIYLLKQKRSNGFDKRGRMLTGLWLFYHGGVFSYIQEIYQHFSAH